MTAEMHAEQRRMAVMAIVASAWLLGSAAIGETQAFGYLAPPLALFALLVLGRYPGERALARRLGSPGHPPAPRPIGHRPPRLVHVPLPRGGRLLGAALAGRAPPS